MITYILLYNSYMFFNKVYINDVNIKTTNNKQIVKHFYKKKIVNIITICSAVIADKCRIAVYYDFTIII
jgi:hypothetical protein